MRAAKQYLVDATSDYLDGSDYVFLVDYHGITVPEVAELRSQLSAHEAGFHVVKNSILNIASKARDWPEFESTWLEGPTAVISGGTNPSAVAKAVFDFAKSKDKATLKGGVMDDRLLSTEEIETLSKLPSLEVLRAQMLGVLQAPAQQMVRVLNAVPQGVVQVLDARSQQAS